MGRESKLEKDRLCKVCGRTWYMTVKELLDHAETCRRLKALGLVNPNDRRVVVDDL